jgi:3-methyladenine DNA glycosylase Mpg
MAITRAHNGRDVTSGSLVVRESADQPPFEIAVTPRIGISRSEDLPLRFLVRDSRFVSGSVR